MSDYEGFEGAESDLEVSGEELSLSGFDAGGYSEADRARSVMQEVAAENGGQANVIDTVGDAKRAAEHNEKENKKHDGIQHMWDSMAQHSSINDHKYSFQLDGHDIEIKHDDLKKALSKEHERLNEKAKTEKDSKKKAQMEKDALMLHRMVMMMEHGTLSDDMLEQLQDYLDRNPDAQLRHDIETAHVEKEVAVELESDDADIIAMTRPKEEFETVVEQQDTFEVIGNTLISQSNFSTAVIEDEVNPVKPETKIDNTQSAANAATMDAFA